VGGVAVHLVGDGPTHREVEGVRRQQRVVRVGERLVVGQFHRQAVTRLERRRERVEAQHVLLDLPRLHRHGTGVRVVRVALGGATVELAVRGLEVAGGDQLAVAAEGFVPQAQDEVRVVLVGETPCTTRGTPSS
jgi:hypothetical protein